MGFFSKKSAADSEDPNRNALFGNRKPSPAPSQNETPPPPYNNAPPSNNANPYAAAARNNSSGYGNDSGYGGGGGYGAPPLDRNNSTATVDSNRQELFGGRRPQQQQQQQGPPSGSQGGYGGYPQGQSGGGGGGGGGYGQQRDDYNPDRQLTQEEEEEEDVNAVKQQIRFTKQESVSSTRNALRVAAQAEETGRNTLSRLGAQGERLHNTEKNLDVASNHNRIAEEKARELKTLNGSMFAIHMKNPLRSSARAAEEERKILDRHQSERDERDRTREFGYESKNRVGNALNDKNSMHAQQRSKASLAERSKYQFEADESDDEKEKEIHHNLDQLGAVTGRLRGLAMATSQEVDRQNTQIDKIMKKSDRVDDQIAITHNRIKKIH